MNIHAAKATESKHSSGTHDVAQKHADNESSFQFVDHRDQLIAQRKVQTMASDSPRAKNAARVQLMANNGDDSQPLPVQKKANRTGLPDALKSGIEQLSGHSMDDVRVHYQPDKPHQLQAHAYAQGTDIHIAAGQEQHLPHEAWHVVQQKQGGVKTTTQMKAAVAINDNPSLERDADVMGAKASALVADDSATLRASGLVIGISQRVAQLAKIKNPFLRSSSPLGLKRPGILGHDMQYILVDPETGKRVGVFCTGCSDVRNMAVVTDGGQLLRVSGENLFVTKPIELVEELDDEGNDDEKPMDKQGVLKLLRNSKMLRPLSSEKIADIESWLIYNLSTLSRVESKEISNLIKRAEQDLDAYVTLKSSTRPQKRKKRGASEKKSHPNTFSNDVESELSDTDYSPDKRLAKYPVSMGAITGRSHVYGIEDAMRFRYLVSGLPYADTYIGLFKQGVLVPRNINSKPNTGGVRKRMREVEEQIIDAVKRRDALFAQIDELNEELRSESLAGDELVAKINQRDEVFATLQELLTNEIRPHIEALLFGSSSGLGPTNEDLDATSVAGERRNELRSVLTDERVTSAVGDLFQGTVPKGLSSGAGSGTHAEQSLINTRTWSNLLQRLLGAISSNKDKPEEIAQHSFTTLQLVINRSTCIGCARELTVELIRFWSEVAEALGYESWRQAKYIFEDYVHFQIDFPAIYENDEERGTEYVNLGRIIAGLRDAGWQVRVIEGVKTDTSSDITNQQAQERVRALASVPQFYVPLWDDSFVCFPVPDALKDVLKESRALRINGILYTTDTGGALLTRVPAREHDSASASELSEVQFLRTGLEHRLKESFGASTSALKEPKGKLGESYFQWSSSAEYGKDEYDEGLQAMLDQQGFEIQNVTGVGMNCLIRAIFKAAGVDFDEHMVTIVRRFLVDLGVAEDGDMLDLLDVQGVSLIHFMQAQGVIAAGTGVTVHFPGNFLEVVSGQNQIHLWYSGHHFQAVVLH